MFNFVLLFLLFCVLSSLISASNENVNIEHQDGNVINLKAEPDYRAFRLSWTYKAHNFDNIESFELRYCEHGVWHIKTRCRRRDIPLGLKSKIFNDDNHKNVSFEPDAAIIQLFSLPGHRFEALVSNLRMLTNYSVTVSVNQQSKVPKDTDFLTNEELWTNMKNSKNSVLVETKSCMFSVLLFNSV